MSAAFAGNQLIIKWP